MTQEWDWQNNRSYWAIHNRDRWEMMTEVTPGTLKDLTKISKLTGLKNLQIVCQPLENLNGLDGMAKLEEVNIQDCGQLSDISTLFTLENVSRIDIRNTPIQSIRGIQNLPGLTYLNLNNTNVTDITPLAECDLAAAEQQGGLSLTVQGNEPVEDLTPLERVHSYNMVFLNERDAETWLPHMQGATVREMNIQSLNPDILKLLEGINVENLHYNSFALDSLENIDSVPREMAEKIEVLMIVGDKIYESNGNLRVETQWKGNKALPCVVDNQTGERTVAEMGKGELDLSNLKKLTGLRDLNLVAQPFTDLEVLRGLTSLTSLNLNLCTKLTDISALADLPNLEMLCLDSTAVTDLSPLTGLKKLMNLNFNNMKVKDWTVLEQIDFSYAAGKGGLGLSIDNCKSRMDFLTRIGCFSNLALGGIKADLWMEPVANAKVFGFYSSNMNQKQLEQFLEQHPEIKRLSIPNNKGITDLTKLLSMPNLEQVTVSQQMKKAIQSIEGMQYQFQMEIW